MVMWGTATAVGVLCGAVFVAGIWRDVPRGRSTLPAAWRASAVDIFDIGLASYVMPLPAVVFMALAVLSARSNPGGVTHRGDGQYHPNHQCQECGTA
jgi:hypothetical protein